jgi:hypothetical protein
MVRNKKYKITLSLYPECILQEVISKSQVSGKIEAAITRKIKKP